MRTTNVAESFTDSAGGFSFRIVKRLKDPVLIVKGWSRCRPGTEMPNGARVFALGSVFYRIKQSKDRLLIFAPADFQVSIPPRDHPRMLLKQMREDAALALRTQWTDKDRHSISNVFNAFLRAKQRLNEELAAHAGKIEEISFGDNAVAMKVIREALERALEKNRAREGVSDALAAEIQAAIDRNEHTAKRIPGVVTLP